MSGRLERLACLVDAHVEEVWNAVLALDWTFLDDDRSVLVSISIEAQAALVQVEGFSHVLAHAEVRLSYQRIKVPAVSILEIAK